MDSGRSESGGSGGVDSEEGGGGREDEEQLEMYWLGAQCPRCGQRPKMLVGKGLREVVKTFDPRAIVMTVSCQGGRARGRRCGTIYSIHAIAFQVGLRKKKVRVKRRGRFAEVLEDNAKGERGR